MDDLIDEELQIMNEQDDGAEISISVDIFHRPISDLKMPAVKCLDVKATIREAVKLMQQNKMGSVVITQDKKIAGIITERDILTKVIGIVDDLDSTPVTTVMTANPTCLLPQDHINHVMHNMHVGGYRHVPIINKEKIPISMVSIKDVMTFILDNFPDEVTNITAEPYRGPVSREGA